MNSLEMAGAGIRAREEALRQALDNPAPRRHEPDGIGVPELGTSLPEMGTLRGQYREAADLALEFARDCCDPEAYGHALPAEVVKRAGRICAMLRPKVCERPSGVGFQEPPPARCQKCDEE